MRVAVIFDNFGPYHHARLRESRKSLDLVAIELGRISGEYSWNRQPKTEVGHEIVNTHGSSGDMPLKEFKAKLECILASSGVSVVAVPGWSSRGSISALLWAVNNGVPVVLMSDSTLRDERRLPWKEAAKKEIVALASSALVAGHPHADYVNILGMPRSQIFLGYDVVDNSYFESESKRWQGNRAAQSNGHLFLASCRFVSKKNLPVLLAAYAMYVNRAKVVPGSEVWNLCLLGDGVMKGQLIDQCKALGLQMVNSAPWELSETTSQCTQTRKSPTQPIVFFPGFRQVDELPRFYGEASAFVHASSTEQWGLVVNEAMACGLPILLSSRVGCAADLVKEGVNGFTFDPQNVGGLTELMCLLASSEFPLPRFGEASRQIIAQWSLDRFASGLACASRVATEIGPKTLSWLCRCFLASLLRK